MKRLGCFLLAAALFACGNNKTEEGDDENSEFSYASFSEKFKAASTPYQLTDTALLNNKDTAAIRNAVFTAYIPDSVKQKLVGKTENVRFIPLAKLEVPKGESYFVIKAVSGTKKAAMLAVFDKDNNYSAAFPFLVPDGDAATNQASAIDKAYTVSRNLSRKSKDDVIIEGKDVYVYNADAKGFTLIMTDILDDGTQELINPIDTMASTQKFTGDYTKDKKNIVSVRDGRNPNERTVFIHFEKNKGECIGELKGSVLMTSSSTAVFRQGGNPCVLEIKFAAASVTLNEVEGCGSYRGLNCLFEGSYPRKKEPKEEKTGKKEKRK